MFLGQIFAKNTKNDPKTPFENQNGPKIEIEKSRKNWQIWLFSTFLCHHLASFFFEEIDLKFSTHIHQPLPSNILYVFLKIVFLG